MNDPLALTFDVGTQSMRGLLVDTKGDIVKFVQKKYKQPYFSVNPGWAEQKPDFYFDILCTIGKELREAAPELMERVTAVTITVIRDTTLCLDKDNKPLRDIVLWLDKRVAAQDKPYKFFPGLALKLVRMDETVVAQHKASVANWIMENQPEIWSKTEKFVMLPTYLNYKLTGNLKDSVANMIGHIPFDYKNRTWMKHGNLTRCICDIEPEKLCELCDSGETIGTISKEISELSGIPEGLPLIATGSDKGCETLGLSVIKQHKAALSFGTTATVQVATPKYFEPQQFLPAYPAIPNDLFNPEIQIYRGYWTLSWFKQQFAYEECQKAKELGCSAERLLDKRLNEVPPGCDGLMIQPFWSPGVANPAARGVMLGFTDIHTKEHIYRAIIEGIGFALMDGLFTMERRSKTKVTELFAAGGGSQSDEVCQIMADMFGLPVKRIQTHEACGLGASMVAFVATGVFKNYDEAIASMVREKDFFKPDAQLHELYMKLYNEVYKELYPKLEPFYRKLRALTKRKEIRK